MARLIERNGRRSSTVKVAVILAACFGLLLSFAPIAAGSATDEGPPQDPGANTERLVVLLEADPVASAVGQAHGAAADAHRASLAEQRGEYLAWLDRTAPQARVVWEYDTVLNGVSIELRGADAAALAQGPHVREVMHPIWMFPTMNESLELIGWGDATGAVATDDNVDLGEGIAVGVIDTGIPVYDPDQLDDNEPDLTHPFFAVTGANAGFYTVDGEVDGDCEREPGDFSHADGAKNYTEFTNCKVYIAKVFKSDDPDATPEALHPHGSHVAGTVAGNSGTKDEAHDMTLSGIAPAAFLGNYNVFPGEEPEGASSDDIAMAVEEAVLDEMDVLNLSLGGAAPRRGWTETELALQAAAEAGVLSAVSAGNSGPGDETVQAPGRAPWVITAGASTNPHFLGQLAEHESEDVGEAGAAVGDFDPFDEDGFTEDFTYWGDIARDDLACRAARGVDLDGDIALIRRGECPFTDKVRNAEDAGAGGVIIFNNVAGDPIAMAHDGTDPFPEIPAVMVSDDYGEALVEVREDENEIEVGGPISEQDGTADIIAGFSSRGPVEVPDEGYIIKPDLTAPGVNVHSSTLCEHDEEDGIVCSFAMFQGTSMASPHLAGAAAAMFWDRGDWETGDETRVTEAKSAITNRADHDVVTDHVTGGDPVGVNHQGVGRLDLAASWDAQLYADPVSVSLGQIRSGRILEVSGRTSLLGATDDAEVEEVTGPGLDGVKVEADITQGDELVITVTRDRGVRGEAEGYITVDTDDDTIRVPYWVRFG